MRRAGVWLVLFLAGWPGACATSPSASVPDDALSLPAGLTIVDYEGVWMDYPRVGRAVKSLRHNTAVTADRVERRLGIAMDPDRPRRLEIGDTPVPTVTTRIIDGRMTQILTLPGGRVARGTIPIPELLAELLARATLSDLAADELPDWYRAGAPLWVSGVWERQLHGRILGGAEVPTTADDVTAPVRLDGPGNDPLSAALFFRFLAQEFGADRFPGLTRALLSAETDADAFRLALGADADSLPLAFESYRTRGVEETLALDSVRRLAAARGETGEKRVAALAAIQGEFHEPWVEAAILSDLALSRYGTADYPGAAAAYGDLEGKYLTYASNPGRDLLYSALSMLRSGDPRGARLRLEAFLLEYRGSSYVPLALGELASVHMENGETGKALDLYREIVEGSPDSPSAVPACLVLAATAITSYRYELARCRLLVAGADPEAKRQLAALSDRLAEGLPAEAEPAVRSAVRDLAGDDAIRGEAAVEFLADVGPLVRPELATAFAGRAQFSASSASRRRAIRVCAGWAREDVWPDPLADFLHGKDPVVARELFDLLLERGVPRLEIEKALELAPYDVSAARAEYDRRFGMDGTTDALASSPDFGDRVTAATRLAVEPRPDAIALLSRLLQDDSPQVRRAAAGSLGVRKDPNVSRVLSAGLEDPSRLVRAEVLRAFARRDELEPVRTRGRSDPESAVRIEAARLLWEGGYAEDVVIVVDMLADPDGRVRIAVERILGGEAKPVLGGVLARAMEEAEAPGLAVRIVRVMSHHTGIDFGYDALGGEVERDRVADDFRKAWLRRKMR